MDKIDLTRSHTHLEANLDFHIISTMDSQGLETQNQEDTKCPQNVMIPNHHKRKHGSNMAKKIVARTRPKNLKLNMEDDIASTLTKYERNPSPVLAPDIPLPTLAF